jgi:hypothetical protein
MKNSTTFLMVCLLLAPTVVFAAKNCEQLKSEIAARIDARNVKGYTLSIVEPAQSNSGTVVGSCSGGTMRVVYSRGGSQPTAQEKTTANTQGYGNTIVDNQSAASSKNSGWGSTTVEPKKNSGWGSTTSSLRRSELKCGKEHKPDSICAPSRMPELDGLLEFLDGVKIIDLLLIGLVCC